LKKEEEDMKKHYFIPLFIVIISVLLIGCAGEKVKPTPPAFQPYKFQANQYEPKVNNFMVILDTSSSMADKYQGQAKDNIAQNFLMAMNETLPELKYNGALRTFGHDAYLPDRSTMLVYGVKSYSTSGFGSAINGVKGPGGDSSLPLAKAITSAGKDLASSQGPIALIIVSDGVDMDQAPVKAAKALNSRFGDRLCIDTVQVGDDPGGKAILEQIAGASDCGFSTTADKLATSSSLGGFVEGIFLAKPAPMAAVPKPMDSDKDGVSDNLDQCPNTPMGATVDARGCWTYAAVVLFDINSAEVKSEAYPMLNEAVLIMKKNPDLNVEVDGHTDSAGTAAYNMTLSVKRAEAIKDHLVTRGVDPKRLTTKGFGITKPAASNDTKEGRAKNRRVEFTPVK
jgi:OOP family OmpA-OmpF porin